MDKIETGLPQMDQEQAAQIAFWGDPNQSLIKDLHAFQRVKLVGIVTAVLGTSVLACAFLPQLTRYVSEVMK